MPRVREARQRRATDVAQPAMTVIGHDRRPPAGGRRARLEHRPVHIPVGRVRERAALVRLGLEAVVEHPHVVPELVREGQAAADAVGDAPGRADAGDAAQAAVVVDDQVNEVGPGPVAHGVHLVQVAVRRVPETPQILIAERLDIRHLGPGHQGQALAHPAGRVGVVGLRDHEVDHRLDGGGAARRFARARGVEHRHVDGHVGIRVAQTAQETDGRQPLPPGGGRTGPGHVEAEVIERQLRQTGRKRPRELPVVGQVQELQARQVLELGRNRARQVVAAQVQVLEPRQVPEFGRDRARQLVPLEFHVFEPRQVPQLGRDRAGEVVVVDLQRAEVGQVPQPGRERSAQLILS